ncbi:MAG: hypothetical protein D084_Lepto4C00210G0002 [Leptospirillum sp. Group IV 'UBA BS']|nr:MAG: hypothetical protein D084_Lepto4C00210G0002 [Leptospirillum sp. Group IV 'UBA BS']MCL5286157.1 hypothetical protein [Nitrospirota bacterium]
MQGRGRWQSQRQRIGGILLAFAMAFVHPAASPGQTFEITGGETVFSQNSQYYFGEVGDFYPLGLPGGSRTGQSASPDVGTAATGGLTLHLFVEVFYFSYETPGPPMTTQNAYNGLNPAAGLRVPLKNGFWEGDVGIALAEAFQTATPVESLAGVYLQTEYYQGLGPGAFDFFANYIGYIQYIYGQARYFSPVGETHRRTVTFFLGPELIGQGNNNYNAGQGGVVLGVALPRLHSYLTFDGGLLRSSVSDGWGGYQGFSWYVSF